MAQPSIIGVHHVKFPVSDLQRSRDWYERVLGLHVLVDFPDGDGVVRGLAGLLPGPPPIAVALREHPTAAADSSGFDLSALPSPTGTPPWRGPTISIRSGSITQR